MTKYQCQYFRRALRVSSILRFIPYVRAVFLTGSIARGEGKKKSDIDFFVVVKPGRMWTCRFLVTITAQIMGVRRYGKNISGRICLNRFHTTDNLEIKSHNAYHRNDYSQAICLVDLENIEEKYHKANKWIGKFSIKYKVSSIKNRNLIQKIGETIFNGKLGNWIEKKLKNYQRTRIMNDPRTKKSPPGKVFVSDQELRFHPPKPESR